MLINKFIAAITALCLTLAPVLQSAAYAQNGSIALSDGETENETVYKINFQIRDGSYTMEMTAEEIASYRPEEREGFSFDGWYMDAGYSTPLDISRLKDGLTLYGKWTFTVTFETNGGEPIEPLVVAEHQWTSFPDAIMGDTEFLGWYTDPEFNNRCDDTIFLSGNTTVYARWNTSYTVTFETNGGEPIEPLTVTKYTVVEDYFVEPNIVTLPDPVMAGAEFLGWYTNPELTKRCYDTSSFVGDTTVYAKWDKPYTVTFETNGGEPIEPLTFKEYEPVNLPNAVMGDTEFLGWYTDPELTEQCYNTSSFAGDTTVYARWNMPYTVTFETNGGEPVKPITAEQYRSVSLPEPVMENAKFLGWYTDPEFKNQCSERVAFNRNITLYAKWDTVSYTVSFETNGGAELSDIIAYENDTLMLPLTSKKGYILDGWYTDSDFTNEFEDLSAMPALDTTLYAKWKEQTALFPETSFVECDFEELENQHFDNTEYNIVPALINGDKGIETYKVNEYMSLNTTARNGGDESSYFAVEEEGTNKFITTTLCRFSNSRRGSSISFSNPRYDSNITQDITQVLLFDVKMEDGTNGAEPMIQISSFENNKNITKKELGAEDGEWVRLMFVSGFDTAANYDNITYKLYKLEGETAQMINSYSGSYSYNNNSFSITLSSPSQMKSETHPLGYPKISFDNVYLYTVPNEDFALPCNGTFGAFSNRIDAPQNLGWDGYTAAWNEVENASEYKVELLRNDKVIDTQIVKADGVPYVASADFSDKVQPGLAYRFRVTAFTEKEDYYLSKSALSPVYSETSVQIGEYADFGEYRDNYGNEDAPILWRCIDNSENGIMFMADRNISVPGYQNSAQAWLNSEQYNKENGEYGFLAHFKPKEKEAMLSINGNKMNVLTENDIGIFNANKDILEFTVSDYNVLMTDYEYNLRDSDSAARRPVFYIKDKTELAGSGTKEDPYKIPNRGDVKISIPDKDISPKIYDVISIPISVTENTGFSSALVSLQYDTEKYSFAGVRAGDVFLGTIPSIDASQTGNGVNILSVTTSDVKRNGVLFEALFTVNIQALNTESEFRLTPVEFVNEDRETIYVDKGNRTRKSVLNVSGDVTGDENVSSADAVMLAQYLARYKRVTLDDNQRKNADVYTDGFINLKDMYVLSRHIVTSAQLYSMSLSSADITTLNVKAAYPDNDRSVIDVTLSLDNNSGFTGFDFELGFDNKKLTPMTISKGSMVTGDITSNINESGAVLSELSAVTAVSSSDEPITDDGELFTIRFKVNEALSDSDVFTIENKGLTLRVEDVPFDFPEIRSVAEMLAANEEDVDNGEVKELKASAEDGAVTLTWKPYSGAVAYIIEVDGVQKQTVTGNEFKIDGLDNGKTYNFTVKILSAQGISQGASIKAAPGANTEYTAKVDYTVQNGKITFTVTPVTGKLPELELYIAQYGAGGSLTSVYTGENTVSEDKTVIEAEMPEGENYKIMLWDKNNKPLMSAMEKAE